MLILYHDDVRLAVDADPGDVLATQLPADAGRDAPEEKIIRNFVTSCDVVESKQM